MCGFPSDAAARESDGLVHAKGQGKKEKWPQSAKNHRFATG
jgi:hypothetical protein